MYSVILALLLVPSLAWSACTTLDITSLTTPQREKLRAALAQITTIDTVRWQLADTSPAGTQAAATKVEVCATTVTGVTLAAVQTRLAAIATAQAAEDTVIAQQIAVHQAATTEVGANQLCTATLAQIDARIDAEKAAVQTDIDAATNIATAKVAMTTLNTRYSAALKQVARCLLARTLVASP